MVTPTNMKKSQQSSFLDDEYTKNDHVRIQKVQNQFKALFIRSLILQSKQKCTNVCQILTPVICLIFTYVMKTVAQGSIPITQSFDMNPYPYKFNDFRQFDSKFSPRTRSSHLQYYIYQCTQHCDSTFLGHNQNVSKTTRTGMLGNVDLSSPDYVLFYPNAYENLTNYQLQQSPFFRKSPLSINPQLFNRVSTISNSDITIMKKKNGLDYLPDGSMHFTTLNSTHLSLDLKINDVRDLQSHRTNGLSRNKQRKHIGNNSVQIAEFQPASGLLHAIHSITSAYIKTLTNKIFFAGYIVMPSASQSSIVDALVNTVAALIYPLGLSLLFPVFLYSIVLEKEQRLIQMMKMNGLKIRYYWLTFLVFNLVLCLLTNIIFFVLGIVVLDSPFFTKTSGLLLFLIAFGWSLAQIGMAAFFQTFLNKSRSANIIGYLVSIWTTMISATLNIGVYQYPSQSPIGLQILPPFSFVRLFYLTMMECSKGDCMFDINNINQEIKSCIISLYIGFVIFFILGIYLFQIIPQEFGVSRSPLYPIHSILNICKKQNRIQINTEEDRELKDYISEHEQDQFSKNERQKVIGFSRVQNQDQIKSSYPLIINNMRKLYKKEGINGWYPAVRSFNLAIQKKQTFGLLGPNGAGKTTLISMITGMYSPNNGNAWIGGYDIQNNIEKAQLQMGVCPQFDLVWPQLSVAQHLYFYARLKGISEKNIKERVQSSMKEVKLEKFADFAANQLSGGMKRRLSVAISLVGDPQIVFLDEPSTGLDPQNRRQLWAVLAECQTKRALFITTHMMQEADTLCHRVGIITSGVLRTIETPIKLKKFYGEGYDVIINTVKQERQLISRQSLNLGIEQQQWYNQQEKVRNSIGSLIENQTHKHVLMNHKNKKIVEFMNNQFPGTHLHKHFNGYLIFKVPTTYKISTLFETMHLVEKQLGFSDIAITNSSLEDVFMNVVSKFDIDQKPQNKDEQTLQQDNHGGINQSNFKKPPSLIKQSNISEGQSPKKHQGSGSGSDSMISKQFKTIRPQVQASINNRNTDQRFDSIISKDRQSILSGNQSPKRSVPSDKRKNQSQLNEDDDREDFKQGSAKKRQLKRNADSSSDDDFRLNKRQSKASSGDEYF